MRVLMFGWEFPPHISGGLGTACFELTRALTRHQCGVIFVIPRADRREQAAHVTLVSAADMAPARARRGPRRLWQRLELRILDSILRPYMNAAEYLATRSTADPLLPALASRAGKASILDSSGNYGHNLMAEVARYSHIAGDLARRETFDVIHVHDWMTIPAGIRAKQASRKPLVVHIHATEFDRSGEEVNRDIYAIERAGMEAADHVVAVSHYTRSIILNRYGIRPDKVSVVHNAVSRHPRE